MSLDSNAESLKQDYLDIFEDIKSYIMYTAQYDETSDIGTIYLRMPKMTRQKKLKADNKAPITEDCYIPRKLLDIPRKLLDSTDYKSLLNREARKLLMS